MGIKASTSNLVNLASIFMFSTIVWNAQHPNACQNIQQEESTSQLIFYDVFYEYSGAVLPDLAMYILLVFGCCALQMVVEICFLSSHFLNVFAIFFCKNECFLSLFPNAGEPKNAGLAPYNTGTNPFSK